MTWSVRTEQASDGTWVVSILDGEGNEALVSRYGSEAEASTLASTVGQHLRWLSEERFRSYYRL